MTEGYVIINCSSNSVVESVQVELLAKSIRRADPSRPITLVATSASFINPVASFCDAVIVEDPNPTSRYFKSLLASPYTKTIAFQPNQLLTKFNPLVWENLRSMTAIVLPKTIHGFNDATLDPNVYMKGSIETQSYEESSIVNTLYFDKNKGCDDVLGLAVILSASYSRDTYIDFFKDQEHYMPSFPEYIWDSWVMTLMKQITESKISEYDFVHCIDLSTQENNIQNSKWTGKWCDFLSYWVNELGELKVENFVQQGLVHYGTNAWLGSNEIKNLRNIA